MADTTASSARLSPRDIGARSAILTASSMAWGLPAGENRPTSGDVLDAAVRHLPDILDPEVVNLVEALALTLVDAREHVAALRRTQRTTLELLRTEGTEARRLRARLHALLDERRAHLQAVSA
jgi:hypothetical protein